MLRCVILAVLVGVALAGWENSVLKKHNDLRSKVATGKQSNKHGTTPQAKYMAELKWDKNLAAQAQAYANKCHWGHDGNRGSGIGENIAINSRGNSYEAMVQAWYDEVDLAPVRDYNKMSNAEFGAGMGHYTQVVWGESAKLGCGYKKGCKGMMSGWSGTMEFLVCRYTPGGNMMGSPIYETGSQCSKCDGKCKNGLCDGKIKGGACKDGYTNCAELKKWCGKSDKITKACVKTCTGC